MATARNLSTSNAEVRPNSSGDSLNPNSSLKDIAYWESRLFSSVYLRNDLKRDFAEKWERDFDDQVFDEEGNHVKHGFYHFYNEFRDIADSLRGFSRKNLSETDTITKIIVPLLDALGWYDNCTNNVEAPYAAETSFTIPAKPKNKTYRTDMILVDHPQEAGFVSDPEDNEKRKKEARRYCVVPLEAKYWNRIVEREKSNLKEDKKRANKGGDDTSAGASFNEQVLNYMSILHKQWGIVTDGNIWRLLNSEISSEAPERCFEFRIESLLDQESKIESGGSDEAEFMEAAKYFYLFFGKASFIKDELGKIFVDEVLKESRKYIDSIEEDLKDRFISAMNIMCDGLLKSAQQQGTIKKPTEDDLKIIRTVGESHLFNILFIKSCEARSILPIKSPNYYNISLTGIIDRISVFEPEKYTTKNEREYTNKKLEISLKIHNFNPEGTSLYKNLIRLTEVIHDGANKESYGFEIKGFRESIFNAEEWQFAKKHSLSDSEMVRILFELGYSKASTSIQRNYQQIPYNYFTPRQLGSIYESFLEYKLEIAKEKMVYVQKGKYKQWVLLTAEIQNKLRGFEPIAILGQAFFTPDNSERKSTGSYYTPDYIVKYILSETVSTICSDKTSDQIAKLKICDPAMGSGHFLIGALNLMADLYLEAISFEKPSDAIPSRQEIKRTLVNKCIYGVDINPRAVKLAKMSLWLESAHWGSKLERLDDQLRCYDSLIDDVKFEIDDLETSWIGIMDVVVGNPPYLDSENMTNSGKSKEREFISANYRFAKGNWDIYMAFMEKAFFLIKEHGVFSYITPDKWLSKPFGDELRKGCYKNLIRITDAGRNVFENATIDSIVTVFSKTQSNDIVSIKLSDDGIVENKKVVSKKILSDPYRLDVVFSDGLGILNVIDRCQNTINSMGICENACATSDAYKIKPLIKSIKEQTFSNTKHMKVINTGTCDKFTNKWGSTRMTYLKDKYEFPVVEKKEFFETFPNSYGKKSKLKKIIIKGLTLLDGSLDLNGEIVPGKSTLVVHSENLDDLKVISALLNSDLALYYIKEKYKSASYNGGVSFTKEMINTLPIPELGRNDKKRLINLVDKILALKSNERDALAKADYISAINAIVYSLYGLSDDDAKTISENINKPSKRKIKDKLKASA